MFRLPASQRRVANLTRLHGWLGLAAVTVLVIIGLAIHLSDNAAAAIIGTVIALAASVPFFLGTPRFLLGYAVIATVGVALIGDGDSSSVSWFAVCVLAAWCVLAGGTWVGVAYWVGAVVLFGCEWLFAEQDPGWGSWIAGVSLTLGSAILIRRQLTLVEQLRAAQADLAARSRSEERNRIARELHDVIAHSLTVTMLHVSGARLAVEHDPADAARSLAEAERLGRQSLAEVRAAVGLLRSPLDEGIAPPTPGINELRSLVAQISEARADVSLVIDGDLAELPATTGSTAYRIVQEALTNAAKHAPGSPVSVRVAAQPDRIDVEVDSAGPPGTGSGIGLLSMLERAEAVGGTCTAGPGGSGWRVHASLPRFAASGPHTP